jgi:hypothetical protein
MDLHLCILSVAINIKKLRQGLGEQGIPEILHPVFILT